jgi:hypothetical protein
VHEHEPPAGNRAGTDKPASSLAGWARTLGAVDHCQYRDVLGRDDWRIRCCVQVNALVRTMRASCAQRIADALDGFDGQGPPGQAQRGRARSQKRGHPKDAKAAQ